MAKGVFVVESYPNSPEEVEAYHRWYDEVHLPEIVGSEGFISARRFAPLAEGDPFLAIYEIEADDLSRVPAALAEGRDGRTPPTGVQLDPPSKVRWYEQITDYRP